MVSAAFDVVLRAGKPDDAERCGWICYEAFKTIAEQHNFPKDFTAPEMGVDWCPCCCPETTTAGGTDLVQVESSVLYLVRQDHTTVAQLLTLD
jgi:hypothetical protein